MFVQARNKVECRGLNLGRGFNSSSGCYCVMEFLFLVAKLPSLKLKARRKQHWGSLPLKRVCHAEAYFSNILSHFVSRKKIMTLGFMVTFAIGECILIMIHYFYIEKGIDFTKKKMFLLKNTIRKKWPHIYQAFVLCCIETV